MQALQNSLHSSVAASVGEFVERLIDAKLLSDKEKALTIWNSSSGDELKVVETVKKTSAITPAKKTVAPKKPKVEGDVKKCQYVYVKGDKEGESCGAKISDESESGSFCKKHLAHEKKSDEKKPAKKSASSAPKKSAGKKKASESKESESEAVSNLKDSAPVFSVKMNKFRNYEHEGTGFLFDRKTEEVYGRQRPDGTITPLTLDDIEVCKHMGFKFRIPDRLVSREDKEDEDDEEEIIESEEEEDDDEDEEED